MKQKKVATIALVAAMAIGTLGFSVPAKAADNSTDYTITIPATLTVEQKGWNATDGIKAQVKSGETFDSSKKLTVTAESTNSWSLKSGDNSVGYNSVGYNLATATGTYSSSATPASWEFSADELDATSGTNKAMGIIVDDYSSKPAGTYTDTVTFTAKVEDAVTTRTVTWNKSDITGTYGQSFTKDGITITAEDIDFRETNIMGVGTFTTASGKFTKIEVTAPNNVSGTGWSGNNSKKTWTGDASSSVSFSGDIMGMGMYDVTIVFTIEE